ncbi:MAG TPA: hypothetical protein HPQ00_06370, partial [Magnetococcales bacterium]|nr:hypothetical protein [Magnetococcales bacterium]
MKNRLWLGSRYLIVIFSLFIQVNPSVVQADGGLSAPEFTDPAMLAQRPEDWQRKPIHYESWAEKANVAITLDQHQYAALKDAIGQFSQKTGWLVASREGNCGTSEASIDKKQVDIAGFCCPPSTRDRLPGLKYHTLGIAALAILVHRDNPVGNLTLEEIRAIFSGRIKNWSQIIGANKLGDLPVIPVGRLHCNTRPGHWRTILPDENDFSPHLTEVGTVPDMIATVAGNPGAIGYEVLWNRTRFDRKGLVKPVWVDGISPEDDRAVASGRYPFYRVENISSWETPSMKNAAASSLVMYLRENVAYLNPVYRIVGYQWLRENGWRFDGD